MEPRWQAMLVCLCLVVSTAYPAAVPPTPDTMVVARSDESSSGATDAPTSPSSVSTEEANAPVKLTEMEVTSTIALRYAHTAVVTTVRNAAARAQEATFRVLLPDTAFISSFTMILDGKPYKAYVKEKEEAKQIYNQAVSHGLAAAHVETKARDSNHFTVSVNVEPHTVAVFNLTYEELLVRRNGVYNHAINLHPGSLVPKLTVTVYIKESQKITELRVPEVRTGNEIDATAEDAQNSKAIIDKASNGRDATITFKPDLIEQQRLNEIYLEKTKESRPSYGYHNREEDSEDREAALGQFVVQYDVERPKDGEILVNDGYFVHFFAPSDTPPLNKYCVFVLDTSGSMMDRKIVQLREAMQTILGELNEGDYFSIIEFASSVKVRDLNEASQDQFSVQHSLTEYNKPHRLVPPSEATPENVAKAKVIVSRLQASGGTNIYSALDVAVELIKKGIGWTPKPEGSKEEGPTMSAPTPELAGSTASTPPPTSNNDQEVPRLEPIIIFLTDGDPTVGQTNPTRIINHLTEKNSGLDKATIYSLAFGEDADRSFLRKLSLRNDGFMRHIYEGADAALQLRDFYRQVSSPLLADVKFVYPKEQVRADSLTKHRFRRYYLGSETVVAGRLEPGAAELTPTVGAFCGVGQHDRKYTEILPKAPVPVEKDNFLPLERLWAYLTIKQLLDEKDKRDAPASDDKKEDANSPDKKALEIALKYSFVTPLTSLVVVKPNATDAVDAESVHKQNHDFGFGAALPANYASFLSRPAAAPIGYSSYSGGHGLSGHGLSGQAAPSMFQFAQFGRPQFGSISAPAIALDAVDMEEEEPEADLDVHLVAPITSTITPFATVNPLEQYHLQEYGWLTPLLAGEGIKIASNTTGFTTFLKLSKDNTAPRPSSGADEACASAAEGAGAGVCVYLTRCASARGLSAATYPAHQCSVSVGAERYAGVCCPKDKVDVEKKN